MDILNKKRGLIDGNEAVARGALESGAGFVSSYPGTPATGVGEAFLSTAKQTGIYFEWSTNEKVALEAAAGAAFSGIKSLVSMKHYGLNVALDSLLPLVYLSCPLVVVVSDDPGCWSSVQTEQDSRWFSKIGKIPIFEPADSQEAKDMTKEAFKIAWQHKIPVIVRLTTRVCYSKSPVNFGKIIKSNAKGKFIKKEFSVSPERTVFLHQELLKKTKKLEAVSELSKWNRIEKGKGKTAVITSGVAYQYIREAMEMLKIKLPLLKIGISHPLAEKKIKLFLKGIDKVIVVEELDPFIEGEIKKFSNARIFGKELFSEAGELNPEHVLEGLANVFNKKLPHRTHEKVEKRIPFFCAGCPHRSTFYAVKKTLGKKIFAGDIGCYMLGALEPYKMQDFIVSMGASIGISHGIAKTTGEKPVIFIGDSTFFHAGMPALLNLVYNKSDALVIILDNRWTAMTGHQPNPDTGMTAMQEKTKIIDIEEIAKAQKVDFVKTSNAYNFNQLCKDIKEAYDVKGVSVIVAKGECRAVMARRMSLPKFEIVKQNPALEQLKEFGCPAIQKVNGKWGIDNDLCLGCSICAQLFPDCIKPKK